MPEYLRQQSLEDRVADLERTVALLSRTNAIGSTTLTNGNLILRQGGTIKVMSVQDPNRVVALIGDLKVPDINGTPQMGILIRRDTPGNEIKMACWQPDAATGVGFPNQFWAVYDDTGNYVMTTDAVSKKGVALPWSPVGFGAMTFYSSPYSQGAAWVEIMAAQVPCDRPKLHLDMEFVGDQVAAVNSGGNWRVMVGGVQVATGTVPATFTYVFANLNIDMTPFYAPGNATLCSVQVQQTAGASTGGRNGGAGAIIGSMYGAYQRGS